MHRARSIITSLNNQHSQKFASWLISSKGALPSVSVTTTRAYNVPVSAEPFLSGSSANYVEDMYIAWQKDPSSVHAVSHFIYLFNFNNKHCN